MPQAWDYIAKVVNIGDSGCGKSSLTIRLCEGRFSPAHDVTIGVEFGSRIIPVSSEPTKKIKLQIWDTAGQESFRSITKSYFRGATGALLVYDITRRETFEHVQEWLDELRSASSESISIILVGNKSDLVGADEDDESDGDAEPETTPGTDTDSSVPTSNGDAAGDAAEQVGLKRSRKRAVSKYEARTWCEKNGIKAFVETSAKTGEQVEKAFVDVAKEIYRNITEGVYDLNDKSHGIKTNTAKTNLTMDEATTGKSGGCC